MMTAGAVGYPLRRFTLFDGLAASYWATGWALVGYLGGVTFENEPGKGILLGLAFAVSITALIETGRYLWRRSRTGDDAPHDGVDDAPEAAAAATDGVADDVADAPDHGVAASATEGVDSGADAAMDGCRRPARK